MLRLIPRMRLRVVRRPCLRLRLPVASGCPVSYLCGRLRCRFSVLTLSCSGGNVLEACEWRTRVVRCSSIVSCYVGFVRCEGRALSSLIGIVWCRVWMTKVSVRRLLAAKLKRLSPLIRQVLRRRRSERVTESLILRICVYYPS